MHKPNEPRRITEQDESKSEESEQVDGEKEKLQRRTNILASRFRKRHASQPRGNASDALAFLETLNQVSDKRHAGKIRLL